MENKTKILILLVIFLLFVLGILLSGCTENQKVRTFGGKGDLYLQKHQKLVMVTWKAEDLWLLTKPMTDTDSAETYTFSEQSSFGLWEGTYTIYEVK